MILFKDKVRLLDTASLKLNFGLTNVSEYKGSEEKLVITESDNFDDDYVYRPGTYRGDERTIEMVVRNIKLAQVENALNQANRIVLDKEPNFYREFYIKGAIEYRYPHPEYTHLIVPIYIKAYRYGLNSNSVDITNKTARTVTNRGNVPAAPIITIYGQGNVTFSINGEHHNLKACTGHYRIDCRNGKQNVYDEAGNPKNITSDYDGDFPTLNVGNNNVVLITGTRLVVEWEDRSK